MTSETRPRWCLAFTSVVGVLDLLSGVALIFCPAQLLTLAGVEPEEDLLFVSFVGAFVAATGLVYLWGALDWARRRDVAVLRTIWASTALVRLVVGTFVVAQVALDGLEPLWLWVGAVDLACAAIQFTGFHRGWIAAEETR